MVSGLLETRGIDAVISSGAPHAIFPLTVSGLGEVRLTVHGAEAHRARRLIAEFGQQVSDRLMRIRDEFRAVEEALGYRFNDPGLLEHALTHRSRAHEDASGGVRDNESLEFLGDAVLGFVISDRLFRGVSRLERGTEVEGAGRARLHGGAGPGRRTAGSRQPSAAGARRRENRRSNQAIAHRRHVRGSGGRRLSRRGNRRGGRVHRTVVQAPDRGRPSRRAHPRHDPGSQVRPAGTAAVPRPGPAAVRAGGHDRAGSLPGVRDRDPGGRAGAGPG